MDSEGLHVAVSGRYGLAHYSIVERKWKLFGNEAQERDFVVVGGMMWWGAYLVVAVYDIAQDRDELRFYPRDSKLDNRFAHVKRLPSQIILLNLDRDKLLVFATDATLAIFQLRPDLNSENLTSSVGEFNLQLVMQLVMHKIIHFVYGAFIQIHVNAYKQLTSVPYVSILHV